MQSEPAIENRAPLGRRRKRGNEPTEGPVFVECGCAAYAFRLDRERYRYLLMMPLQQLAYRQMMYLVLIHSCVTALTGGRLRWQKLKRTGEAGTPAGLPDDVVKRRRLRGGW